MPHDDHFLSRLDRVTRAHTEYALGLYRDHEAVKYVLEHVTLPDEAERVALSIDDPRRGPFVIVTREGHFVTCLGTGMSPGQWPVVSRQRLDALLAKVAEKRERRELAQRELRPNEEEGDLFKRLVVRGVRLAREDFLAVSAFEAMLGTQSYLVMLKVAVDVLRERPGASNVRHVHGGLEKAVERHDRLTWLIAHLTVLSGAAERRDLDDLLHTGSSAATTPTNSCSVQGGLTFVLRSAWLAARMGKGALPVYVKALERATDYTTLLDASLCVAAIGMRHASLFGDARRALQAQTPLAEKTPKEPASIWRAALGQWLVAAMDDADARIETCLLIGRETCVAAGAHLPDGHPYKFARAEDVPDSLARTTMLQADIDIYDVEMMSKALSAVALAARAQAEDFYHPRDAVRAWLGAYSHEETIARLERFYKHDAKKVPVTAAPTPGRNDPCTCGSGKKWKKCHGSGAGAGAKGS